MEEDVAEVHIDVRQPLPSPAPLKAGGGIPEACFRLILGVLRLEADPSDIVAQSVDEAHVGVRITLPREPRRHGGGQSLA